MTNVSILICLTSAIASWQLILWLTPILKKYLVDIPNDRSSHNLPTPRGGGVVFVLITIFVSIISSLFIKSWPPMFSIPLICTPLAIIGLIDDRLNLPASWRYGGQLLTSILLIKNSSLITFNNGFLEGFLFVPIILISLTALINFINFMDGLDGLVAGCLIISLFIPALTLSNSLPIWSLIGALIGFLYLNWSPSKIFMGDVGSTFIGSVFAGLLIETNSIAQIIKFLLIATPLLADSSFCVIRRYLNGQNIFSAHRLHLYQRLYQAGLSQTKISILYSLSTLLLCIVSYFSSLLWVLIFAILIIAFGFYLDFKIASPFIYDSSKNS